jgi:hypothetical protein
MLPAELAEMNWWYRYLMELNRRELNREWDHRRAAWWAVLSLPARFSAWVDETVERIGTAMLSGARASPVGPTPPPVVYCNEKTPYWRRGWEIGFEWCGENGVPAPRSGMQARLEEHVRYRLEEEFQVLRRESTVRKHVVGWIKQWREIDFKNRPLIGLADDQRA